MKIKYWWLKIRFALIGVTMWFEKTFDNAKEWVGYKAYPTLRKHPMLWFIPALVFKFFVVDYVLHLFLPKVITFDPGVLHKPSMVIFFGACFVSFSYALLYVFQRSLYNHIDDRWFQKQSIQWGTKDTAAACLLCVYFLGLCLMAA